VRPLGERGAAPGPWLRAGVVWEDEAPDAALIEILERGAICFSIRAGASRSCPSARSSTHQGRRLEVVPVGAIIDASGFREVAQSLGVAVRLDRVGARSRGRLEPASLPPDTVDRPGLRRQIADALATGDASIVVVVWAARLRSAADRATSELIDALPPSRRLPLWQHALRAAARGARGQLLLQLPGLIACAAGLGGRELHDQVAQTLVEIRHRW
jgi:hypothetical protein